MPERLRPGEYRVGTETLERSRTDGRVANHAEYGVINGSTINETTRGPWGRIFGVKNSKWYTYRQVELLVKEVGPNGEVQHTGTAVRDLVDMFDKTFDSKSDAVDYLLSRFDFDETY
jgi:hypothetical protein